MPITLDGSNGLTTPNATVSSSLTVAGGTVQPLTAGTAQASTSGTSIDFTGIPSWVKRITVMFNGVSTNGTSLLQIQGGAGSIETTGYASSGTYFTTASTTSGGNVTSGFITGNNITAANTQSGNFVLTNVSGNIWTCSGSLARNDGSNNLGNGVKTFSGTLDRVRITTVNGTDTFDAGSINILYE